METFNAPPFESISETEEKQMTIGAFLGALDDQIAEFASDSPERRADSEIMATINGIFDVNSEYYSEVMVEQQSLFSVMEARLQEACANHSHFNEAADQFSRQNPDSKLSGLMHKHDETATAANEKNAKSGKEKADEEKKKRKRKEKEKKDKKEALRRKRQARKLGRRALAA